jgi:hypothetical protein
MNSLALYGGAGIDIMVVGAGSAIAASFMALLGGTLLPFVTVVAVFVALTLLGCIWGLLRAGAGRRA